MNPGPYHPLESHEEIRVVYLRPGKDDDAIRIELKHLHRGHLVRYEALSYVWGTALATQAIIVNDTHDLIINENLDIVLRHLRLLNRVRILWIDAICINQSDLEERTQQVQMMGLIYSKAYEVIIWLGPDEGYNYHNLLLHIDKLTRPNSSASFVRLIREMCQLGSSPWFSRVWVAQELVLA
ncbi:HET-domain-containing protein, partial [Phaeosphaeriaceae sp. SRC1lsM3a]